jgi:hypothetical protein
VAFYHPNSAGTGAAMKLEARLNRSESDRYNCFFMDMASQKSKAGMVDGEKTFAAFDWEHKLTVKLGFLDVCEMLTVLEGRSDTMGHGRNGLFHQNGSASTVISLQKADKGGFLLGLSRKTGETGAVSRVNLLLSDAEGVGLRAIFQAGLFFITFHDAFGGHNHSREDATQRPG